MLKRIRKPMLSTLIVGLILLPRGVRAEPNSCPIDLESAIAPQINQPQWARSRWGIHIQELESGEVLYRHNAQGYFLPASNAKLLTTAAALHQFNPNVQIQTPIRWQGTAPHLERLHITGQGDPTITTADLRDWARSLHDQGIRSIEQLTVSETNFPRHDPTWEFYDLNFYYAVPVTGLILNDNSFLLTVLPQAPGEPVQWQTNDAIAARQWRIHNRGTTSPEGTPYDLDITGIWGEPILNIAGTVAADNGPDRWWMAVRDPARYFLDTLRSQLILAGITVENAAVVDETPSLPIQETWLSPPLSELIRATNQPSNNLYAEVLRQLLAQSHPSQNGQIATQGSLTNLGVDPDTYQLADGSGLSRHNLVSPEAIAQTLYRIAQSNHAEVFLTSLPVGGESGTLRRRFRESAIAGQVWAKTGTLTGVSALSGYLLQPNYDPLIFSILLNQATASVREQRQAIDEIVEGVATWQRCQSG